MPGCLAMVIRRWQCTSKVLVRWLENPVWTTGTRTFGPMACDLHEAAAFHSRSHIRSRRAADSLVRG